MKQHSLTTVDDNGKGAKLSLHLLLCMSNVVHYFVVNFLYNFLVKSVVCIVRRSFFFYYYLVGIIFIYDMPQNLQCQSI